VWAAKPIELGLTGDTIYPRVLGPPELLLVTDPAEVRCQPEVAVLSAMAHGNEPDGLKVVMAVLEGFERPRRACTVRLSTRRSESRFVRKAEEILTQAVGEFQEPPFVQKLKALGRAEGQVETLRAVLFKLVARANLTLGEEERARIEGCDDPAVLDRWVNNALGAKTVADLFQ
jgi:hypothetical protein